MRIQVQMKKKFKMIICWFICGFVVFSAGCGWNDKIDVAKIETGVAHLGDINLVIPAAAR